MAGFPTASPCVRRTALGDSPRGAGPRLPPRDGGAEVLGRRQSHALFVEAPHVADPAAASEAAAGPAMRSTGQGPRRFGGEFEVTRRVLERGGCARRAAQGASREPRCCMRRLAAPRGHRASVRGPTVASPWPGHAARWGRVRLLKTMGVARCRRCTTPRGDETYRLRPSVIGRSGVLRGRGAGAARCPAGA